MDFLIASGAIINLQEMKIDMKYGWLVYALSIPAAAISIVLLIGGKSWTFWLGGFIFLIFAAYGYRIDYVKKIQWRKPYVISH